MYGCLGGIVAGSLLDDRLPHFLDRDPSIDFLDPQRGFPEQECIVFSDQVVVSDVLCIDNLSPASCTLRTSLARRRIFAYERGLKGNISLRMVIS